MERAVYVTRAGSLRLTEGDYTRLYFGAEFCQNLIPTVKELGKAIDHTTTHDMAFTLMTPYVTAEGLASLEPLLDVLAERVPEAEVVINDWGTLHLLEERSDKFTPVLGRLITKQKRGPRAVKLIGNVPDTMLDPLRSIGVTAPLFKRFLANHGISRVELDNPLHGLDVDLTAGDPTMAGSLYTPYVYISTTRKCLTNACDRTREAVGIRPCGRECDRFTFTRTHPSMPVPLILRGNTHFVLNDVLPELLEERGIDRLVVEPEVPL